MDGGYIFLSVLTLFVDLFMLFLSNPMCPSLPSLSFPLSPSPAFWKSSAVLLDKREALFRQLFQQEKQRAVSERGQWTQWY